jgi:hypothetical protein
MAEAYTEAVALTPSDTVDLGRLTDAVYVGGAGVVTAVLQHNRTAAFTAVAGALLPIRVRRVNATGTTATLLVALYQT